MRKSLPGPLSRAKPTVAIFGERSGPALSAKGAQSDPERAVADGRHSPFGVATAANQACPYGPSGVRELAGWGVTA